MVFQTSILDLRRGGVNLPLVYVHCAIYKTYLVSWFSRHLCSIWGVGGRANLPYVYVHCAIYTWNLFGIMLFQTSMLDWRREWGQSAMGICPLCYIWNLFGVMVFQTSMLNWRRGVGSICHGYMCIVLYMKLICCNGFPDIYAWLGEGDEVHLPWVYVHCAIHICQ